MPLQPQTAAVPLFGGLDLKTDAKFVAPGKLLTAENVRWASNAQASKRYGQTALPANLDAGVTLGTYLSELLAFDGAQLQSYAQAQQAWVAKGAMSNTQVAVTPSIRSAGSVSGIASVFTATAELYAWEDSRGGVWYTVRDAESGTFLVAPTQVDATGQAPAAFKVGQWVLLAYGSGFSVKVARFYADSLQTGVVGTQVISTDYAGGSIAACTRWDNEFAVVAWNLKSAVGSVGLRSIRATGFAGATATTVLEPGATFGLNLAPRLVNESGFFYTFMLSATDRVDTAYFQTFFFDDLSTGSAVASHPVPNGRSIGAAMVVDPVDNVHYRVYADADVGGFMPRLEVLTITGNVGVLTIAPETTLYGLELAAAPTFILGDPVEGGHFAPMTPYAVAVSGAENADGSASQQASFYLLKDTVIAKRFLGGQAAVGGNVLPSLSSANGQLSVALAQQVALRVDAGGTVYAQTGLAVVDFSFPNPSPCQILTLGTSATVTCGNTYAYDGAVLVESGFWEFPDGIQKTAIGSGGALGAGLYTYQITYEWVDSAGNSHYSAPSYPVQVTTVANGSVELVIPYTALTLRRDATVNIYRGLVDQIGPLYFVASTPNLTDGTETWTYTDTASDTSISGQRLLYAPPDGSGELENDPPPPFKFLVATKTRLFGVAEDDAFALWYSKPLLPGRPAEWSTSQVIRVETDGGPVTGLGALDAQCVLFKGSRVYYLPGDGPDAAGKPFNAFPQALTLISTTSGCSNSRSILNTHEGVFFQSAVGLQVLTRSLQTELTFGILVQPLVQSLDLTAALSVPSQNQFRWVSSDGTALVYDYVMQRWSTYTNYDAVAYVMWNGAPIRLRTTGDLFYEDTSLYTDNLRAVQMVIETAWLKPGVLAQGYAAVWYAEILGEYVDTHKLQVQVAYDYLPVPAQTVVWDPTTNNITYGTDTPYGNSAFYGSNTRVYTAQYQVRVALSRQTCQSVKFRISDVSQLGASCNLNELTLQLGVIGGINRLPTTQQV